MKRRFEGVARIAVLRPSALGDFVFALPALQALRVAYPEARISLLGRPWHLAFLGDRPGPWDEVIVLPPIPGVAAPEQAATDAGALAQCLQSLRERRFDLAIQMYGGGRYSNPFIAALGARITLGLQAPDAPPLQHNLPYVRWRNERARLLELVGLAGAMPEDLAPLLAVTPADQALLHDGFVPAPGRSLVVLQPGASDARRRWPLDRFAAVGDALAARGAQLVINGGPDEQGLCAALAATLKAPAADLAGRLPLGGLAALLARARLMVSNDTGPLHLAQAVGARSVGIYWFMNLLASAPLVAAGQREAFSTRIHCPLCGQDNVRSRCAHDPCFVDDVGVDEVKALALDAFEEG
jgi:ADP-heptose:LPS heptosyltransferase